MKSKSCLIIAGEKSGEDHALSFFPHLIKNYPHYNFFGVGGDVLKAKGLDLLYHLKDFSSMGFLEVVSKIPFYFKAMKNILNEVHKRNCKVAILIDFQEFNYNLAKKLKKQGINVLYYVAPQAWIWREYRAKILGRSIHTLYTILPFEKKWFKDRGVGSTIGVVHPVLEAYRNKIVTKKDSFHDRQDKSIKLLLLPGSRNHEVRTLLPIFVRSIGALQEKYRLDVAIVKTSSVDLQYYEEYGEDVINYVYPSEKLSEALGWADLALASSGTVTLISGLFQVPTVVCYKVSLISEIIYKLIVRYYGPISLANIILENKIFPELLQRKVNSKEIVGELENWICDKDSYLEVRNILGEIKNRLQGDTIDVSSSMGSILEQSYLDS